MREVTKKYLQSPEGQEQIKGLDASIELWGKRVEDHLIVDECPLCEIDDLNDEDGCGNCEDCIIALDTGTTGCHSTPYYNVDKVRPAQCKVMLDWLVDLKERMQAIQGE